jgi:hypothetical protein
MKSIPLSAARRLPVSRGPRLRPPRGMAVVLVLGMLAMTLALSYASLRGQATVAQLAQNLERGQAARSAAESGVYAALRNMSQASWPGVSSSFTGNVTDDSWYEVSFATGDALLTPADPSYGEYAYRVTITSVGYARDADQPDVRAVHSVEAIVQLARRTILPEPATWADLEPLAVHQWGNRNTFVQVPARIDGPTRILGKLYLCPEYPLNLLAQERYLRDLNKMQQEGLPDYRPFQSPLSIAYLRQDTATMTQLQSQLGLETSDATGTTVNPVAHPNVVLSYKLYPGGVSYPVPILQALYGNSLQNLTIQPDPVANPLGLVRSRNSLGIYNNVRIQGTIISEGTTPDIQVYGTNVQIEGVNLPPLEGNSQAYQLPVALIRDDLKFHGNSAASVKGLVMVYDEFELRQGPKTQTFQLTGQLITSGLAIRGRNEFALLGTAEWETQHSLFLLQYLPLVPTSTKYFPTWMENNAALPVAPGLRIARDTSGVKYHWHTWTQPIYQKDPTDPGLRWNLVRWVEGS